VSDVQAPLYDVEDALRILAQQRHKRDEVTMAQCDIADRLAHHLKNHFGPEAIETAGLALVLGAASAGALKDVHPAILINVLAFTGQRLVVDARAADGPGLTA
jgi:hypothetical protein